MSADLGETRRFRVHVAGGRHQERVVTEASFEAAAVAYVEHLQHPEGWFRVIVHDVESGHEHSFHFDLTALGSSAD